MNSLFPVNPGLPKKRSQQPLCKWRSIKAHVVKVQEWDSQDRQCPIADMMCHICAEVRARSTGKAAEVWDGAQQFAWPQTQLGDWPLDLKDSRQAACGLEVAKHKTIGLLILVVVWLRKCVEF